MNSIQDSVSALGLGQSQAAVKKNDEMGQDAFMKLMLAQLKNQDPMQPMENGEFLAQIAQFNTVTGVQDLQKSFESFASSMTSNQALQASALVGRTVRVESDYGVLPDEGEMEASAYLPISSQSVRVSVFDENGTLVRQMALGSQEKGEVAVSWDGLSDEGVAQAPGRYELKVEALIDGEQEALPVAVNARVESVTLGSGGSGPILNLEKLGSATMSGIYQIL